VQARRFFSRLNKARKGMAVFFSYVGDEKGQTLHSGASVLAGEKYVATLWIRQLYWKALM